MNASVLHISPPIISQPAPKIVLSFLPFINFLKTKRETSSGHRQAYIDYALGQFEPLTADLSDIDINDVHRHEVLLEQVYNLLSPLSEDENTHFWGLSKPVKSGIFYSTNALFELFEKARKGIFKKMHDERTAEEEDFERLEYCYMLILEKCYNISISFCREMVFTIKDEETHLDKFLKINVDNRFVDVTYEGKLPELSYDFFHDLVPDNSDIVPFLRDRMPIDQFTFSGFNVVSIEDVTAPQTIENIKNAILDHSLLDRTSYYSNITSSLKTLVQNDQVEFGLLPVLQVNEKIIYDSSNYFNSKLINLSRDKGMGESMYMSLAETYLAKPRLIYFKEIKPADEVRQPYLKLLKDNGIVSYALIPVYYNHLLTGVLEIYSSKEEQLTEKVMATLEPALPLLSQLLKTTIDEFNDSIEKTIKDNFTSLQPSVQWKFNEVAAHYLRDKRDKTNKGETEDIIFERVFPLYGAVDIRNSTIQRNAALHKDLYLQFNVLLNVLTEFRQQSGFKLIDEKIFACKRWLEKIGSAEGFTEEQTLNEFLQNDIAGFVHNLVKSYPHLASIADNYFKVIDEENGLAFENRRRLESSITTVISAVNNSLEQMKEDIFHSYPVYFEKFRTDGVEYDIYIGQSIAPQQPFSDIYLKNLQLWQLSSMAAIGRLSHSLLPSIKIPVETTQLIFIHPTTIDIKFRKDEKRFDVEGAYNIRYHIVKKRIDKVNIRNSSERLTQPHKIALVYFNRKEANDYLHYIHFLQEQKVLLDDLEELELEDLQGVSGLKAMRVGINLA